VELVIKLFLRLQLDTKIFNIVVINALYDGIKGLYLIWVYNYYLWLHGSCNWWKVY